MTPRISIFFAVCLTALSSQAIDAQEAGNGLASRTHGEPSGPAAAGPLRGAVPVGGLWTEFSFDGPGSMAEGCLGTSCTPSSSGNSVFGDSPPWTFTVPAGGEILIVTDAFLHGDQFEVFDFGVSIGSTSAPTETGGGCGDNPEPCMGDPLISHGSFPLDPGPHEITIQATASPFNTGAAYFRLGLPGIDFHTVEPCRVVDTRLASGPYGGPALTSNQLRHFLIAGQCGIPDEARAISFNVTAIAPSEPGYLRIFPGGGVEPSTSSLNFNAGQTRTNNGISALFDGSLRVRASAYHPSGTVHLVIDVNGYFQ